MGFNLLHAQAWQRAFSQRATTACGEEPMQTLQPVTLCAAWVPRRIKETCIAPRGSRPSYTHAPDCITPEYGGREPQIKGSSTNDRFT